MNIKSDKITRKEGRIPAIVIFGPTASGKTEFAISVFGDKSKTGLAKTCEIISADSVQVYSESFIASARPTDFECENLVHHLVGVKKGYDEFSVSDFVRVADDFCYKIFQRKKVPILLGGSAFFLKNFLFGLPKTPKADTLIREKLQKKLNDLGPQALYQLLETVDPESANKIKSEDHYRVLRALEVYETTKKPLSSFKLPSTFRLEYDFLVLSLTRPRDILYRRIENRVDDMFASGLYEEFLNLYKKGYKKNTPIMKAIGYSEFFLMENPLNLKIDEIETVKSMIKRDTRRYAKRQETFFKKIPKTTIINLESNYEVDFAIQKIKSFLYKIQK